MVKIVQLILGVSFLIFIGYNYLYAHTYYGIHVREKSYYDEKLLKEGFYDGAWQDEKWRYIFLFHIVLYLVYYFSASFIFKQNFRRFKLSGLRIFLLLSIYLVIFFNFIFLIKPVAVYLGNTAYELPNGTVYFQNEADVAPPEDAVPILYPQQLLDPKSDFAPEIENFIHRITFGKALTSSAYHIVVTFIEWVILVLWMYVLGSLVLRLLKIRLNGSSDFQETGIFDTSKLISIKPILDFFFTLGIGFFSIVAVFFMLGYFSWLNSISLAIFLLSTLGLGFTYVKTFFIHFAKKFFTIECNYFSLTVLSFILFFLFFGLNFLDNIRVFPNGWDAAERYLNFAHLISQSGSLIKGFHPYYWELFISSGFLFSRGITSALFMTFLGTILAFISFYFILFLFLPRNLSVILTTVFYSLPFVFFQIYGDPKTDLPAFFIANLSLLSFFLGFAYCKKDGKIYHFERVSLIYFGLSFFFAGLALGIKYTAILYIFGLLALFLYNLFRLRGLVFAAAIGLIFMSKFIKIPIFQKWQEQFASYILGVFLIVALIFGLWILFDIMKSKICRVSILLIFPLLLVLPMLPWGIKGFAETRSFSLFSILNGQDEEPYQSLSDLKVNSSGCGYTGNTEDYQRYLGFSETWKNYLFLPWNLTMNKFTQGLYVDISYVFLAFIPLVLLFLPGLYKDRGLMFLLPLGIFFWIFWLLTANGVIWYGIYGFIFLFLVIGALFSAMQKKGKFFISVFNLGLIVWLFLGAILRIYSQGDASTMLYGSNTIDAHTSISLVLPGYDFINETFIGDASPENRYLYRIGTPYRYFIDDNIRRVINDQFLDKFMCLYQEKDPILTMRRLKEMGVKYILLDNFLPTISQNAEQTLTKKYNVFLEFAKNLELIYKTPAYRNVSFYKVPSG